MLSVSCLLKSLTAITLLGAALGQASTATQKASPVSKPGQQPANAGSRIPALNSDDVAAVHTRLSEAAGPDGIPLYTPGNLDIALELPAPPNLLENQALSNRITDSRCFASAGHGVGVFIGYSAKATAFGLKEFAAEFVREVQGRAGLANVKFATSAKSASRMTVYGTFNVSGATGELNGIVLNAGSRDWVVLTVYPRDKDDSHDLAERILHSIAITSGQESARAAGTGESTATSPAHER